MKRGDGDHLSPSIDAGDSWVSPRYLKWYDLLSSMRCFDLWGDVFCINMWVFLTLDSSALSISYNISSPLFALFSFWTDRAKMDSGGGLHSPQELRQLDGGITGKTRRRRGFGRKLRRCKQTHLTILCLFPLRYITIQYSLWDFGRDVWLNLYCKWLHIGWKLKSVLCSYGWDLFLCPYRLQDLMEHWDQ